MIKNSDPASIFRGTRGSGSIEISVPGAFTAIGFSGLRKKPGASAAEGGRLTLFKTIDEDQREGHDHINRLGRSTYLEEKSVQTSGATPPQATNEAVRLVVRISVRGGISDHCDSKPTAPWQAEGRYPGAEHARLAGPVTDEVMPRVAAQNGRDAVPVGGSKRDDGPRAGVDA